MPILPLQKRRNWACAKTGLVLFAFFVGLGMTFSAKAKELGPVLPFAILDNKWTTPDGFLSGKTTLLPSEIEVPSISKQASEPEEELLILTPPLMPGPWAWKNVQDVPIENDALPFFDDPKHWKNLGDVRDQLDNFHEVTSLVHGDEIDVSGVRFPLLPGPKASAISDVRISKPKLEIERKAAEARAKAEGFLAKKKEKKKRLEKTSKACVALSERRQRELEAMESDRRTLSALREALKDLGVTKKLAFMIEGATSIPLMEGGAPPQSPKPTKSTKKTVP